jgi:hypothetical protein
MGKLLVAERERLLKDAIRLLNEANSKIGKLRNEEDDAQTKLFAQRRTEVYSQMNLTTLKDYKNSLK